MRRAVAIFFAGIGIGLAGCSDDGLPPTSPFDSGVTAPNEDSGLADAEPVDTGFIDMGFVDTGPRDCSDNPFMCAPMQLRDAECRCLEACQGTLVWNPVTMSCEAPCPGACCEDSDCPTTDDVCLNPPLVRQAVDTACADQSTCECFTGCDPFTSVTQSGCPAGLDGNPLACVHLLDADVNQAAVCLDPTGGATQGEVCTNNVGRGCDGGQNFFCIGLTETSTSGICQRLCDTDDVAFCATFGPDLVCNPVTVDGFDDLGICGPPPTPIADFGQTCADSTQCTGICSTILGGCSENCRVPRSCGEGSNCINFTGDGIPPGEESLCMVNCSSADDVGDAECRSRNVGWVCRDLVTNLSPLCSPGCLVIGCPAARPTCDPASGRCI